MAAVASHCTTQSNIASYLAVPYKNEGYFPSNIFADPNHVNGIMCSICFEIPQVPHMMPCQCQKALCYTCITILYKKPDTKQCPSCKDRPEGTRPIISRAAMKEIYESIICCRFCQYQGKLENMAAHENNCMKRLVSCQYCKKEITFDTIQEHENQCTLPCQYCKDEFRSIEIKEHEKRNCIERPFYCEIYGCDVTFPYKDLEAHQVECPFRLVKCDDCNRKIEFRKIHVHRACECTEVVRPCQNYKCDFLGKFSDMVRHDEECQYKRLSCSWTSTGCCRIILARGEMDAHEKDLELHMKSIAMMTNRQIQEHKQQIMMIETENATLKAKIAHDANPFEYPPTISSLKRLSNCGPIMTTSHIKPLTLCYDLIGQNGTNHFCDIFKTSRHKAHSDCIARNGLILPIPELESYYNRHPYYFGMRDAQHDFDVCLACFSKMNINFMSKRELSAAASVPVQSGAVLASSQGLNPEVSSLKYKLQQLQYQMQALIQNWQSATSRCDRLESDARSSRATIERLTHQLDSRDTFPDYDSDVDRDHYSGDSVLRRPPRHNP